jgi:hypothetical protein
MPRLSATVTSWDKVKSNGFIRTLDGDVYWVGLRSVCPDYPGRTSLQVGMAVTFEPGLKRGEYPQALDVEAGVVP